MIEPDGADILLVEDNSYDADLTLRALRKCNLALRLFRLEDGAQALDFLFRRGEYAGLPSPMQLKVILLDLKLPKVDGLQVLEALKADERTRFVPVVVVTSSAQDADVQAAYDLGANSYVVKPVDANAFVSAIHQIGLYWLDVNRPPS